jgi:hypothetical protein
MQLTGRLAPLGEVGLGLILIIVILLRPQGVAPAVAAFWSGLARRLGPPPIPETRDAG